MNEHIDMGNPYIYALLSDTAYGKPVYDIHNARSNTIIAMVGYYPAWKRYVLHPFEGCVFDVGCLQSIIKFIEGIGPQAK